jgi:hypothetical protein
MPEDAMARGRRDIPGWFRLIDKAFWLVWLGFPVMILVSITHNNRSQVAKTIPADRAQCLDLMPDPATMSATGKVIYWGLFAFELSIYVVLLATLHVIIHRFASGRIYVRETLQSLSWIGAVLIVWPFLDVVVPDLAAYVLHQRGDITYFAPTYVVDVGPIAVGVFLFAFRTMLEHAMAMKSEHDLTI